MPLNRKKVLLRLVEKPAWVCLTEAERVVFANRKLIKKAMRMGYSLDALSKELNLPKRTLQRHIHSVGLFFRKPRSKMGTVVRRNTKAISRAKLASVSKV